eukprot:GHRQ01030967.1.p1 GENE.GHRQ01030967.1~~GHRQ01030967.1.p1  ORF type:complete len:121 (+),score=14.78 GHRQ01030967.1:485-847(+)
MCVNTEVCPGIARHGSCCATCCQGGAKTAATADRPGHGWARHYQSKFQPVKVSIMYTLLQARDEPRTEPLQTTTFHQINNKLVQQQHAGREAQAKQNLASRPHKPQLCCSPPAELHLLGR